MTSYDDLPEEQRQLFAQLADIDAPYLDSADVDASLVLDDVLALQLEADTLDELAQQSEVFSELKQRYGHVVGTQYASILFFSLSEHERSLGKPESIEVSALRVVATIAEFKHPILNSDRETLKKDIQAYQAEMIIDDVLDHDTKRQIVNYLSQVFEVPAMATDDLDDGGRAVLEAEMKRANERRATQTSWLAAEVVGELFGDVVERHAVDPADPRLRKITTQIIDAVTLRATGGEKATALQDEAAAAIGLDKAELLAVFETALERVREKLDGSSSD